MRTSASKLKNKPLEWDGFKVKNALAGLELGPSDHPMLDYLDFISTMVPIGQLNLAHIVPKVRLFSSPDEELSFFEENYQRTDELTEQIRQKISGWSFSNRIPQLSYHISIGNPLEELLHQASDIRPDLVIIGQRSTKKHHGILAKNFARKVKSNALVIPENTPHSLSHILVPIDFSKYALQALRLALDIRKGQHGATKISCLHVFDLPAIPMDRRRSRAEVESVLKQDREAAFSAFIRDHFPEEADDLQLVLQQKSTKPIAHYIHHFAEENQIDLTVMGAMGHSKVELLLMGSVTEKYLSLNQQIPTLIVKQYH